MKRILLVDDSRVTREVLKVFLIANGVKLLEAADGIEALDVVKGELPDLVIADLRMPRLDGRGLCEAMMREQRTSHIPVLILTSQKDLDTRHQALSAGAREVLEKPIQPRALIDAVNRHLPAVAGSPGAEDQK